MSEIKIKKARIVWMYAHDAHQLDKNDHDKGVTIFTCPKCGLRSKVIADSHDDFICDCGEEMTLGVHNKGD